MEELVGGKTTLRLVSKSHKHWFEIRLALVY